MDFKQYKNFSTQQFIEDPAFRKWVKSPTDQSDFFWQCFLEAYPLQKANLDLARTILTNLIDAFEPSTQGVDMEDEDFRKVLRKTMRENKWQKEKRKQQRLFLGRLAFAASILLLVGMTWFLAQAEEAPSKVYSAGYGEWKTVVLPDSSIVKLTPNSTLTLSADWSEGGTRKVWIEGEAFFKVKKKPSTGAKFQVLADDLTIEVLGTSFNVNNRAEQTQVFLEEGIIKLDLGNQVEELKPGDFVVYSNTRKTIVNRLNELPEVHASWKDGDLIMEDLPEVIFQKIEELYGVEVQINQQVLPEQIKRVAIPKDKLEIVIPILETTLNIKIKQKENLLIVEGK
ncbi:MAG: FecR domain-containing protein [Saprospiraceae bacterium]